MLLTFEILPLAILEKSHPLIEPRHLPYLCPLRRSVASNPRHIGQYFDFWYFVFDSVPDPLYHVFVIPDDPPTVSSILIHYLFTVAGIDHGVFPDSIRVGLGSGNQLIAFCFGEAIVQHRGVQAMVLWEAEDPEVDNIFRDLCCWLQQKLAIISHCRFLCQLRCCRSRYFGRGSTK